MEREEVSAVLPESTRKIAESINSEILRRLADVTQTHAATCMGVSESTISRMRDDLPKLCQLLASIGMKVADSDSMVVDRDELEALESIAFKYFALRRRLKAKQEGLI